jgi:hypothetical protein
MPDFVHFMHRPHVAAGLSCEGCHTLPSQTCMAPAGWISSPPARTVCTSIITRGTPGPGSVTYHVPLSENGG